jgi:diadenosine tetraphosphatase ApaH/serine/threonine PP2A family protein phosphatase
MRVVTEQLDSDAIEWLSNLPDRVETPSYILAHARPVYQRDPGYPYHGFAQGDYGVPPKDATRLGPHLDGKMALLGHTHEQHGVDCSKFPGQSGAVVNPGSVGVPWYKDARYAVVDTETQEFDLHRVEYDTSRVEAQLEAQGTPAGKYSESNRLYNATS